MGESAESGSRQLPAMSPPRRSVAYRRKIVDALWWAACVCCLAVVITPTLWMLIGVVSRAVPVFHWSVLVQDSQGNGGGLRNAIIGTAVLAIGVILVGGTVSVLTGIYLSEFATGKTRSILRGAYEVLSGIPSIVLGYVAIWPWWCTSIGGFRWRPGCWCCR